MALVIDETMLTAYALGELSGTERAAVAAHLAGHPDARLHVADVRGAANLLSDELARESFGGLSEIQHAAIDQRLEEMHRPLAIAPAPRRKSYWDQTVWALSAAAAVAIVAAGMALLAPIIYVHVQTAMQSPPSTTRPQIAPAINPVAHTPAESNDANSGQPDLRPSPTPTHADRVNAEASDPGDQWIPQPDNMLVNQGSGREDSPFVPARATDLPKPVPQIPVARGPTIPGNDDRTPVRAPDAGHPLAKPSDNFANLPVDQQSPDKNKAIVGTAANGALPNEARYEHLQENPYIDVEKESLSGFSAGVDTASYSNIRRFLTYGKLPPHDAVRIEEMLNYFPVRASPATASEVPLGIQVEIGACPWLPERRLMRVCVTAHDLPPVARPPVNLVFVIDVSDRMKTDKSKLALIKDALRLLGGRLSARDRLSIIAYTRETGIVLPPTAGDEKTTIWASLARLESGGQMSGGKGIAAAYEMASRTANRGGINRIILVSDGNWNVGATDAGHLASTIRQHVASHVSLTVLGVGIKDFADATLQRLAAAGNGTYAYIDTLAEARKVLVDQMDGSLVAVASDVKVEVAFNPASAHSYRLLGYERRSLSKDELSSHSRPGGDMGAGQSVTALYEVVPNKSPDRTTDMATVTVRYVDPITSRPDSIFSVGQDNATPVPRTTSEFRFAAAVAEFGLLLRDSDYKGNANYASVIDYLQDTAGGDETGYRQECLKLVRKARELSARSTKPPL